MILHVLYGDGCQPVGRLVDEEATGRVFFSYAPEWLAGGIELYVRFKQNTQRARGKVDSNCGPGVNRLFTQEVRCLHEACPAES